MKSDEDPVRKYEYNFTRGTPSFLSSGGLNAIVMWFVRKAFELFIVFRVLILLLLVFILSRVNFVTPNTEEAHNQVYATKNQMYRLWLQWDFVVYPVIQRGFEYDSMLI